MTGRFSDPVIRRDMSTDLAAASRGIPADWEFLREGVCLDRVACPDEITAQMLATFRYGPGVTVRRQGARS